MKKALVAAMVAILLVCGCASKEDRVFRERIVPDIEQVLTAYNNVLKEYSAALDALNNYVSDPSEEKKDIFVRSAESSDRNVESEMNIRSMLTDEDNAALEKLNIARADHDFLFDSLPTNMQELKDWSVAVDIVVTRGEIETGRHELIWRQAVNDLYKAYLAYGIMHYAAYLSSGNNAYLKDRFYSYTYLIPDDMEWLYDRDEINKVLNSRMDELERIMNAEGEWLNEKKNEARKGSLNNASQ